MKREHDRPEGPRLVPQSGQLLLLLCYHVLQLLGVRWGKEWCTSSSSPALLLFLTVLIVVDLVGHGEERGVLLDPVLHGVHQVLVGLHHFLLQSLNMEVKHQADRPRLSSKKLWVLHQ